MYGFICIDLSTYQMQVTPEEMDALLREGDPVTWPLRFDSRKRIYPAPGDDWEPFYRQAHVPALMMESQEMVTDAELERVVEAIINTAMVRVASIVSVASALHARASTSRSRWRSPGRSCSMPSGR